MKKITLYISCFIILLIANSCVEEFNAGTTEFEDRIVIEALLTDQLTSQTVLLSRTFKIDETQNQQEKESGANVRIVSGSTTYNFSETSPGTYTSDIQFRAELNTDYQLFVTTQSGRQYESEVTQLRSNTSQIENLYAVREVNDDGVEGVSIYIDSFDPTGNSIYYTFDVEETHQIIAPFWVPDEVIIASESPLIIDIQPRRQEERVCYNTQRTAGRLTTDTNLLSEDRVSRFLVKFIPGDDIRLSSRYSISVKQYTNTKKAYDFHQTLNELSSVGSLLSPVQPGFVSGNIVSTTDPDEAVIGYFEVASERQERIFFNRNELLPDTAYDWNCEEPYVPPRPPDNLTLVQLLRANKVVYVFGGRDGVPIHVIERRCGDCTASGTNVRPSFWID